MGWLTLPYLTAEVVSKGNTRRGCTTKTSCASELEGWGRRRLVWEPDPPRIEGKGVCRMSVVGNGWRAARNTRLENLGLPAAVSVSWFGVGTLVFLGILGGELEG